MTTAQSLFEKEAQFVVLEPAQIQPDILPFEVVENVPQADLSPMEVNEPGEVQIVIGDLPGAPDGLPEILEVSEEDDKDKKDENEAKEEVPEKLKKWDWSSRGATGFVAWVKERFDDVPKHSGMDTAGLDRAISYLDKLDDEISKAMRMDLDGELDANRVEEIRAKIEEGIEKLEDRKEKLKKNKKSKRKTKRGEEEYGLVKEGQKIAGVHGIVVTVPLLISRIGRVCINSTISAGKDIEAMYEQQSKLYSLNFRERAEVRQFIEDCGFPMRQDRAVDPDDDYDPTADVDREFTPIYKS